MNLTRNQIYLILNNLGIKYIKENNNWITIKCPSYNHEDKNPSAGINLDSGVINCFSCNFKTNLIKLLQERKNLVSYKEALNYINKELCPNFFITSNNNKTTKINKIKNFSKKEIINTLEDIKNTLSSLNPNKYYYTFKRGFTKEFVEKFNIKRCLSGIYHDYFIIPIIDNNKNIYTFEARKLQEYEYLQKVLNKKGSFKRLNLEFKDFINQNYIKYVNGKIINTKNNKQIKNIDYRIFYLLKQKVLYPKGVSINKTIFNINNLNYNEDLYVCEGIGSIPKLYSLYPNCTCTFGSNISKDQIEYLNKFKRIIIIPDNDRAGILMTKFLHKNIYENKTFVLPIESEDIQDSYIKELKEKERIPTNKYLIEKFNNKISYGKNPSEDRSYG